MENNKLIAFEYIIYRLVTWIKKLKNYSDDQAFQEFNKLKLFKLHFFVSAIDANESGQDLLNTFDDFYALPYGPVESYVYNHLDELNIYSVTSGPISQIRNIGDYFDTMDPDIKNYINIATDHLHEKNEEIVAYPAFDLVELSHQWPVWRLLYNRAQR